MENSSKGPARISVASAVDVAIYGGTSAAVAFALSCAQRGFSCMIVAPHSYLGEDICGIMRYWPQRQGQNISALADEVFPQPATPPTPLHVKRTLEQRLLAANVPFLFQSLPAGVLRKSDGAVCGMVFVNRGGRHAVRARCVVDASVNGGLLALAGCDNLHDLRGRQQVSCTVFYHGKVPQVQGVEAEELPGYDAEDYQVSARRYALEADWGDGNIFTKAAELSRLKDRLWAAGQFQIQNLILPTLPPSDAVPSVADLQVADGLLALTEALPLANGAEVAFSNPLRAMAVAEEIARGIALGKTAAPATQHSADDAPVPYCAKSVALEPGQRLYFHEQRLRQSATGADFIEQADSSIPLLGVFDVVVVGGGTGGAPAAIAAARAGARTVVVESTSTLGGVGTIGQIAKYWYGNRVGFTEQIDKGVAALETNDKYRKAEGSWSVSAKAAWYLRQCKEDGAVCLFNSLCPGVLMEGGRVAGVVVAGPFGYGLVRARSVVDSTGCADIPAAVGAPTIQTADQNDVAVQGTGLAGVTPGKDYKNSDHGFSDDSDPADSTGFFAYSRMKAHGSFDSGELIGSRERRQIIGQYVLSAADILCERRFPDTICVASSNFDSHGFTIDPVFMLVPPDRNRLWADIPLRCLLPQGVEGVLVTGLAVSAHRDALPVIRMQPDVQNQGYVAGYIAACSALGNTAIGELDIQEIQQHLIELGNLPERVLGEQDSFPVPDAQLVAAIETEWNQLHGVALILHTPERSLPLLRTAYRNLGDATNTARSLRYAQLLALLGDTAGLAELSRYVAENDWDTGWNYRGMHQFGASMSQMDAVIVCLGQIGSAETWEVVLEKIRTLPAEAEFSHFRALALACNELYLRHPQPAAAPLLASLLERPGYCGHAAVTVRELQEANNNDNLIDNEPRNRALREIYLARALYCCGDWQGRGRTILETYRQDLRAHFARHAEALLAKVRVQTPEPATSC